VRWLTPSTAPSLPGRLLAAHDFITAMVRSAPSQVSAERTFVGDPAQPCVSTEDGPGQ
jgi:hypothetical protein